MSSPYNRGFNDGFAMWSSDTIIPFRNPYADNGSIAEYERGYSDGRDYAVADITQIFEDKEFREPCLN